MRSRFQAEIFGRVQGVFFRYYTKERAEKLSLGGFVQNQPDGSLLVVAEGEKENLEKLLEFLKRGPDHAQIERVRIKWQKYKGEFNLFEIKY